MGLDGACASGLSALAGLAEGVWAGVNGYLAATGARVAGSNGLRWCVDARADRSSADVLGTLDVGGGYRGVGEC